MDPLLRGPSEPPAAGRRASACQGERRAPSDRAGVREDEGVRAGHLVVLQGAPWTQHASLSSVMMGVTFCHVGPRFCRAPGSATLDLSFVAFARVSCEEEQDNRAAKPWTSSS